MDCRTSLSLAESGIVGKIKIEEPLMALVVSQWTLDEGVSLFPSGRRPRGEKCAHRILTFVWAFPKVSPLLCKNQGL